MGHLAIVNSETINRICNAHPYISYSGYLNSLPYKTISDLFADALAVRRGDKIFTWMVDGGPTSGVGFDRYYIADGTVVFDPSSDYPIKVGVLDGYKYDNPISEEEALDIFRKNLLWNAIGKKSLGRGRSLSHQTIDEDSLLIDLLNKANSRNGQTCITQIITSPTFDPSYIPISINSFAVVNSNPDSRGAALNSVPINSLIWNCNSHFLYEKTLEAYLCENIDSPNTNFCSLLGYPSYSIVWIGNYLPYGVAGKNIDLVCEISNGTDRIAIVIELKKPEVDYDGYKYIVDNQLSLYADFIKKAFMSYRGPNVSIEQVVLTHTPSYLQPMSLPQYKSTKWIGYDINANAGTVSFQRIV